MLPKSEQLPITSPLQLTRKVLSIRRYRQAAIREDYQGQTGLSARSTLWKVDYSIAKGSAFNYVTVKGSLRSPRCVTVNVDEKSVSLACIRILEALEIQFVYVFWIRAIRESGIISTKFFEHCCFVHSWQCLCKLLEFFQRNGS